MATTEYISAAEFANYLKIDDSADDQELGFARVGACRAIDATCGRRFWVDDSVSARTYRACHVDLLDVHDISTTTGLVVKTDDNFDGTYETTWTSTDYQLEPVNGVFAGIEGYPYFRIRGVNRYFPVSPMGIVSVQVTAKWGWAAVPGAVKEAALLQASRFFQRRQAPFGVAGSPQVGSELRLLERLDPDVAVMLRAYRRDGGMV